MSGAAPSSGAGRGPLPAAGEDRGWRRRAACAGLGELFFAPSLDEAAAGAWSPEPAKAVCARCPVAADCREWAIRTRQSDGVWGGLAEVELRRLQRRPRGKSPAARAS
ncbi:MAG: WhiB family transcriptional regulator [Acidimicrobiales bacterium]